MREEDLYNMSDEDLEKAFETAKAEGFSIDNLDVKPEVMDSTEQDVTDTVEMDDDNYTTEEEEDEEFDNGLEQSDEQDSEDHDSEEDSTEEESDEATDETDEDDPDGDSETDESDTTDDTTKEEDDSQTVQTYKVKANGQEYEFKPEEILEQFPKIFGQAMDYTKKMQAIKPWRKTIDAIEQADLKHDDVNLMIDVLKGDKDAISEILKRTGTDALDLNTEESTYQPKDYGRDESALALKDVVDSISGDKEYAVTQHIVGNQWDDASWSEMKQNPELVKLLHVDVQSGMYDTISPMANKLKVYDGGRKSDLDYYKEAAQQHFAELSRLEAQQKEATQVNQVQEPQQTQEQSRIEKAKAQETKRESTKKQAAKRKAAAPSTNSVSKAGVIDYLDDSDDAFEEWYKNLQDEM